MIEFIKQNALIEGVESFLEINEYSIAMVDLCLPVYH